MGAPGCPEFACWTPSIERVRIVSTASWSSWSVAMVIAVSGVRGTLVGTGASGVVRARRGAYGREGPS
jgi:hypothetical protein